MSDGVCRGIVPNGPSCLGWLAGQAEFSSKCISRKIDSDC